MYYILTPLQVLINLRHDSIVQLVSLLSQLNLVLVFHILFPVFDASSLSQNMEHPNILYHIIHYFSSKILTHRPVEWSLFHLNPFFVNVDPLSLIYGSINLTPSDGLFLIIGQYASLYHQELNKHPISALLQLVFLMVRLTYWTH